MSSENGGKYDSRRAASGIGIAVVTGIAVFAAQFLIKDPGEDARRNADAFAATRNELRDEVRRLTERNIELQQQNSSLEGRVAGLEALVSTRLGVEGFTRNDANAKDRKDAEIIKRLDQMDEFLQAEIDEVNADVDQIRQRLMNRE